MTDPDDPRGLIREAYRIDGITAEECRSIFLDWSIDREVEDPLASALRLHEKFGSDAPDHPMTQVLSEARPAAAKRRGGRRGRVAE